MFKPMRVRASILAAAIAASFCIAAAPAGAQQQQGLVNVDLSDVTVEFRSLSPRTLRCSNVAVLARPICGMTPRFAPMRPATPTRSRRPPVAVAVGLGRRRAWSTSSSMTSPFRSRSRSQRTSATCTSRLTCQAGRAAGFSHVPPDPSIAIAGSTNNSNPVNASTCRTARSARRSSRDVQRARSWPGSTPTSNPTTSPSIHAGPSRTTGVAAGMSTRSAANATSSTAPSGSDGERKREHGAPQPHPREIQLHGHAEQEPAARVELPPAEMHRRQMERQHDRHVPERREHCAGHGTSSRPPPHPDRTGQHDGDVEGGGPDEQIAVVEHHGVATESIR